MAKWLAWAFFKMLRLCCQKRWICKKDLHTIQEKEVGWGQRQPYYIGFGAAGKIFAWEAGDSNSDSLSVCLQVRV